jgi:hypothetical protein
MEFFSSYEAELFEQLPQTARELKPNLLKKSIFIHIPKTGGTFIREHFNEQVGWWEVLGVGHGSLKDFPEHADKFSFTFIRNPEQWLISSWGFTRRILEKNNSFEFQKKWSELAVANQVIWRTWKQKTNPVHALWHEDFDIFLCRLRDHAPNLIDMCYQHFSEGVDFVGKNENLVNDLITALEMAGEDMEFYNPEIIRGWQDRRNVTERAPDFAYNKDAMNAIIQSNPIVSNFYDRG